MTRTIAFALVAATLAAACSAPETPRATSSAPPAATPAAAPPLAVHVVLPDKAGPETVAWAEELKTAVASRAGELTLAPTAEEARLLVRLREVRRGVTVIPEPPGEGETVVMRGTLVVGDTTRDFDLAYRGEARPQAEALARNLRRFAAEMSAATTDPTPKTPAGS